MSIIFHTMKTTCKSTSVLELTANRNDGALRDFLVECLSPLPHSGSNKSMSLALCLSRSTTRAEHRKLPKSMMIGKALLSGLWAHPLGCFTVRFTFALLTLARLSLSVSPFFSPLSLRRGVVVVCFEVIMGELLCLSACAMWSRGSWLGSLVSAWCFCCFTRPVVWPGDFLGSSFCFYCHTMSRWYNAIISCMN